MRLFLINFEMPPTIPPPTKISSRIFQIYCKTSLRSIIYLGKWSEDLIFKYVPSAIAFEQFNFKQVLRRSLSFCKAQSLVIFANAISRDWFGTFWYVGKWSKNLKTGS